MDKEIIYIELIKRISSLIQGETDIISKMSTISCEIFQSFCHTGDPYSYTSNKKIWLHDLEQSFDDKTIIPLLDWEMVDSFKTHIKNEIPYGICTDYPHML